MAWRSAIRPGRKDRLVYWRVFSARTPSIISRILLASASIKNGFVTISIPGSKKALPAASSAYPVTNRTLRPGRVNSGGVRELAPVQAWQADVAHEKVHALRRLQNS